MKKIIRVIFRSILIVLLLGLLSSFIDYLRMNDSKLPIFNVSSYNSSKKLQVWKGMFYTASRKVRGGVEEDLSDSTDLKFNLLYKFDLAVETKEIENNDEEYNFVLKKSDNCSSSSLYYADLNIKVYTYCLSNILVNNKELSSYFESNNNIIDDIDATLDYRGLLGNGTMIFNGSNIRMYRCKNKDVYIGESGLEYQNDFCINKDDDYKFIFEIKEETEGVTLEEKPEIFYEDENYQYQFDKVKSNYIFITTPEVRGKAETKRSLKEVLNSKLLTIDDLEKKGLSFTKIDKNKE